MDKAEECQPGGTLTDRIFKYLFLSVLLMLIAVHLLATYWRTPFLWGVHHWHFLPRWLGWASALVVISFYIPALNGLALKLSESILGGAWRILARIRKHWLFGIGGLISVLLFWSLRTKLFLLGDGYFILTTLSGGMIFPTAWLDGIIHQGFYRLLVSVSPGTDPSLSHSIPSVLCGGIFIYLILTLSDLLGDTSFQKVLIFFSLLTLGSIELFFGYVESYTLLSVSLTLFILFSILYLRGRVSVILPFVALVMSMALHASAMVFVSAFFYIVLRRWRGGSSKLPDLPTLLCFLGCLGATLLVIWKVFFLTGRGDGFGRFLPLLHSPETGFTMFCGAHIGEFINGLLLVSPVGVLSFLLFPFYLLRLKSFSDPILNFLLICSLSGLILVFAYNCHWGSADWDLMSFPGIFFTLFGILLLAKWGGRWARFKNYGLILIAASLFHTIPWILVNADAQLSVDRYVMIATNDAHILCAPGGGMWRVGRVLQDAGFTEKAEELLKRGIRRNPEEIGCYSYLSAILHRQGRDDEAIFYLETALQLKPQSDEVRYTLGQMYLERDLQKAIFHLDKVKARYEHHSAFVTKLAKAYLKAGRPDDARRIVQQSLAGGQETATMRGLLGTSFFLLGDSSNARVEWERALDLNPDEPLAKTGLEELGKTAEE